MGHRRLEWVSDLAKDSRRLGGAGDPCSEASPNAQPRHVGSGGGTLANSGCNSGTVSAAPSRPCPASTTSVLPRQLSVADLVRRATAMSNGPVCGAVDGRVEEPATVGSGGGPPATE